ncbi:MAG: ISL3 family transposase [Planctomycetaceae bacterium]|nr:ISL3 family transposase [Planctomycetaceae bacterium]
MSTSLLYHAFGLRGYRHVRSSFAGGRVTLCVRQPRNQLRCSECGSDNVWAQGGIPRTFRTLPIGLKPVQIEFAVPRVHCFGCGLIRQVKLRFADPRKSYTRAFERYAIDLSQHMTIKAVATHLQVSWDVIKDIQAASLQRRFGTPKLGKLTQIAIDEIAVGKGHQYLTVVLDLCSGAVVFVGDGKGVEALLPFWKRLRASRAKIKAVATDMGKAYIRAVRDNLPGIVHVFDHFHVVKLFNDKLSALRRELYRQAQSDSDRKLLKGTRWLLLKNPENLDATRNETQRLRDALDLNTPLTIAYYLKEDLRQIWSQVNKRTARRVLRDWMARAHASGIRMLQQFANTLEEHMEGILAYYDYRISTGPLEGTNTKIKALQRQAYGFRDRAFYKLKILGIHESKYALVG